MPRACLAALLLIFLHAPFYAGYGDESLSYDGLPPMVFAVPRIQIAGPGEQGLDGVDVGFAVPLRGRTSLAGSLLLDFDGDQALTATYNVDSPLDSRTTGRLCVGVMENQLGLGVSAHRVYADHGAGVFVGAVGGELEVGAFLSTPLRWGRAVGKADPTGARLRDVGEAGALATLGIRPRQDEDTQIVTATAWFPRPGRPVRLVIGGSVENISQVGPPFEQTWTSRLGSGAIGRPVVVGENLYIAGRDGVVRVLRLSDGSPLWTAAVGSPITTQVAVGGGRLYVGTESGHLVCLAPPRLADGLRGEEMWRYDAGSPVRSTPVLTPHGRVVFGTDKGALVALETTGKDAWHFQAAGPILARVAVATRLVGSAVHYSARSASLTLVYCAAADGTLYALREQDGKKVWTVTTQGPFSAPPLSVDGLVVANNEAGEVLALQAGNGRLVWEQKVRGPVRAGATAADGKVYVPSAAGVVSAFALANGKKVWTTQLPGPLDSEAVVAGSGHLLIASRAGYVYALRRSDGQVTWADRIDDPLEGAPAPGGQYLALAGDSGRVWVYKHGGSWRIDAPVDVAAPLFPSVSALAQSSSEAPGRKRQEDTSPTPALSAGLSELPVTSDLGESPAHPPAAASCADPAFPSPVVAPEQFAAEDNSSQIRMSLLTVPGDPQQPAIQVVDRGFLSISGPVPSGTVGVTVNDVPVPVFDGAFRTQLKFEGTGAYPLTIKHLGPQGVLEIQHRIVVVTPGDRFSAPAPIFTSTRGDTLENRVTFTVSAEGKAAEACVSVLEIREENGRPLRAWAEVGSGARTFQWDVRDQWGNLIPDGEYLAVYTLRTGDGRSRSILQPIVVDSAGM